MSGTCRLHFAYELPYVLLFLGVRCKCLIYKGFTPLSPSPISHPTV